MAFWKSLLGKKEDKVSDSEVDVQNSESKTEDESDDWVVLPNLHSKGHYDKLEFERNRAIEKLMEKYKVSSLPLKGYDV